MADICYNEEKVNVVISQINQIQNNISDLTSNIRKSIEMMVCAHGFQNLFDQINVNTFAERVNVMEIYTNNLVHEIRQKQISMLSYSQDISAINSFLDGLSRKEYDSLDLSELDSYIGFDRKAGNVLKGLGADVATVALGALEGFAGLAETGADLINIGKSALLSIFTGAYDLITGEETTKEMWEQTKAQVSEKKVESIFNNFYDNNEIGQAIKNNAYGFDFVRGISKGVSRTAGMILLNMTTGGLISGLGIGASGSIKAAQLAATSGLLGFSSGAEQAWADGASIGKGLLFAGANGLKDAVSWYLGAKINMFKTGEGGIASGIFKGAQKGVERRIAMDSGMGALSAIIDPFLKTWIYKDYGGDTIFDNYCSAFKESGGWGNVASQALMGGISSAIGEFSGARKLLASEKKQKQMIEQSIGDESGKNPKLERLGEESLSDINDNGDASMQFRKTGVEAEQVNPLKQMDRLGKESDINPKLERLGEESLSDINDNTNASLLFRKTGVDAEKLDLQNQISTDASKKLAASMADTPDSIEEGKLLFLSSKNKPVIEHVDADQQKKIVADINSKIVENGEHTAIFKSTKELTSRMLEQVDDMDHLKVRIGSGYVDANGDFKPGYKKDSTIDYCTYSGREALGILKRIEGLEARIDMSLSPFERAKQIYDIVGQEYTYSNKSLQGEWAESITYPDYSYGEKGHRITGTLRGMTDYNDLHEEGLVCAGYSHLFKELCNRADIQCDYIEGMSSYGRHAWNVVVLPDGEEIPFDCTWHSGGGSDWFGKGNQFDLSHYADRNEVFRSYGKPDSGKYTMRELLDKVKSVQTPGTSRQILSYFLTGDDNYISDAELRNMANQVSSYDYKKHFYGLPFDRKAMIFGRHLISGVVESLGDRDRVMNALTSYFDYADSSKIPNVAGLKFLAENVIDPTDFFDLDSNENPWEIFKSRYGG